MAQHDPYLSEDELASFARGEFLRCYQRMGAHLLLNKGAVFSVWAPNAERVSVVGDFNDWDPASNPCSLHRSSGVWSGFAEHAAAGQRYRYSIVRADGSAVEKSDPFAFAAENRPGTASIVCDLDCFTWSDSDWIMRRRQTNPLDQPMSVYEMHLGSWRHFPDQGPQSRAYELCRADAELPPATYTDLAQSLPGYVSAMGFTHVEFMPVMEHPYDGSWGYQLTGYFAPTSRFGTPAEFMNLIDALHAAGIGVILDIVPAHFAVDDHGLASFDGTPLYEYADPAQGQHSDWGTYVFDYGKAGVRQFLISHCLFWAEKYHIDGFRVDAVASMIYLDYSKNEGEWAPNKFGGHENLEAIEFLQQLNEALYAETPGIFTVAEESTAWPMVSRPTYVGGLGFGFKWNMGWMHDVLEYFGKDPVFRSHHHHQLTFSLQYAFQENFVLPLSHDEVVHGKQSLVRRMPGHWWERFAGVRALLGFTYGHPGKKLLFMGDELGTWDEWYYKRSLDWSLLDLPLHRGLQLWVRDLNNYLKHQPALFEQDFEPAGFEWVDCRDSSQNIISFMRYNRDRSSGVLVVCNFAPVLHPEYVVGVPAAGDWLEVLNSDAECYGGSGEGNSGRVGAEGNSQHSRPYSLRLCLPPLSVVYLQAPDGGGQKTQ